MMENNQQNEDRNIERDLIIVEDIPTIAENIDKEQEVGEDNDMVVVGMSGDTDMIFL